MKTRYSQILLIICFIFSLSVSNARATLIAVDNPTYHNPVFPGAPIILDTVTDKEWMNPFHAQEDFATYRDSYQSLQQELAYGGDLWGWKLASALDLVALMDNAGLWSGIYSHIDTTNQYSVAINNYENLFGLSWNGSNYYGIGGIISDTKENGDLIYFELGKETFYSVDPNDPLNYYPDQDNYFRWGTMSIERYNDSIEYSNYYRSAWLVRDHTPAPVPEPSTILLLGSGLLSLGWYSRKRRKE